MDETQGNLARLRASDGLQPSDATLLTDDDYKKLREETTARVRDLYKERHSKDPNFNHATVGKWLGISASAVSHIFSGRTNLGLTQVIKLAALFNVPVVEIVQPGAGAKVMQSIHESAADSGLLNKALMKQSLSVVSRELPDTADHNTKFEIAMEVTERLMPKEAPTDEEIRASIMQLLFERSVK